MSEIIETDSPDAADIAVIADGLRAYNTAMAGYDDHRSLAVFVTDPATGKVIGGLYGASSSGQLRVERFFLPQELRRGLGRPEPRRSELNTASLRKYKNM